MPHVACGTDVVLEACVLHTPKSTEFDCTKCARDFIAACMPRSRFSMRGCSASTSDPGGHAPAVVV